MDWYIYFIIGFGLGFVSPVIILLWMGRKQIKEIMKPYRKK